MRAEIEFYFKPEKPVSAGSLVTRILDNNYSALLDDNDRKIVDADISYGFGSAV